MTSGAGSRQKRVFSRGCRPSASPCAVYTLCSIEQCICSFYQGCSGWEVGSSVPASYVGAEPESPLAVFEAVYAHEVHVTGLINKLMDLVLARSDHASSSFLQWFVDEQVEEEASADDVVQKLKLIDKTEGGLFLLDQEMDKRTFSLPPDLAGVF